MLGKLAKQKCISQIVFAHLCPCVCVCVCSLHARLLRLCFDCTQALNLYTIWHFYPLYADPDRLHRRTDVVSIEPVLVLLCSAFQNTPLPFPLPCCLQRVCSICSHCLFMAYLWQRLSKQKKNCQAKTHTHTYAYRGSGTLHLQPDPVWRLVSRANCVIAARIAKGVARGCSTLPVGHSFHLLLQCTV